ncbi:hypothetical protein HUJ05_007482 [Dendroctonus ponderosae]|nr:hypothetical protein HUJ05_007482 [Dendroctonus ponderosae]
MNDKYKEMLNKMDDNAKKIEDLKTTVEGKLKKIEEVTDDLKNSEIVGIPAVVEEPEYKNPVVKDPKVDREDGIVEIANEQIAQEHLEEIQMEPEVASSDQKMSLVGEITDSVVSEGDDMAKTDNSCENLSGIMLSKVTVSTEENSQVAKEVDSVEETLTAAKVKDVVKTESIAILESQKNSHQTRNMRKIAKQELDTRPSTVYSEAPLHVAAALGNAEVVKLLLQYGAAVKVQSGEDKLTPLHLAAEQGYPNCVQLLIAAGANVNAPNRKRQTPLHVAVLAQCTETCELLLQKGASANAADSDGRTPLHCATVNVQRSCECVRALLRFGADPNVADAYGYTPMHSAALNEFSNCVILLLQNGGDVTLRTKGGVSVLNFITKKTPEVIPMYISRLDNAIRLNQHDIGDVDCQIKIDFRILVPTVGNQETSLLTNFIEVGHKEVLEHPLCETFLLLKWRKIRHFFFFSLLYQTVFVKLFSFYIQGVYLKDCPSARRFNSKKTCLADDIYMDIGYCLIGLNVLLMFKELFQILHSWKTYILEWENYLQWGIIISVFCCVQPMYQMNIREYVFTWQHHVAAASVFLAWVELMMIVARFPTFGVYVQMFTTVSINFFKFMCAYLCLIIAFTLCFGVIFANYPAFKQLQFAFIKVIIMMSGELEYEDVFYSDKYEIKYPYTAHIAYLVFVILVTIVLSNLMVGMAVNDIQGLQKSANLDRLVRLVRLMAHLESMLFSNLLKWVPLKVLVFLHSSALLLKSQRDFTLNIRPNDPRENKIPKNFIENAFRLAVAKNPHQSKSSSKTGNSKKKLRNMEQIEQELTAEMTRIIKHKLEKVKLELRDN